MTIRTRVPVRHGALSLLLACFAAAVASGQPSTSPASPPPLTRVAAAEIKQTGTVAKDEELPGNVLIANESEGGSAGATLMFDFDSVGPTSTPLARLSLPNVDKVPVKRPGQKPSNARGAFHVFAQRGDSTNEELVGACCVKPGGVTTYVIDVTAIVSETLAKPKGQRNLVLNLRMLGRPAAMEVYKLPTTGDATPSIEIASPENWSNDWDDRLRPIGEGPTVYREACMPFAAAANTEVPLKLMFPPKRIVEVIAEINGEKLQEGRDYLLRDGRLILPAGTHAPVQIESEFFMRAVKPTSAAVAADPTAPAKMQKTTIQLQEGTFYHDRQITVTYEPASRDWKFPPPVSSPAQLPRLMQRLKDKQPVSIILFGDSIETGGNASRYQGCWPYQPAFGELVAWKLNQLFGSKITAANHSRGGGTSAFGLTQTDSQVGWFKPDLAIVAFGMNDRGDARRVDYKANLEKIIETIRAASPDTEVLLVTSMMNNPKQPAGSEPVLFLRDEALKISKPGVAIADMTSAHFELLQHKDYLDTSGNGANHPNDFLHRIYAQRILEVLAPDTK